MKRILFLGTPDLAVPSLKALAESGLDIRLVVTRKDRPVGRGRKLSAPPVKEEALKYGLPVFQPESINSPASVERLKTAQAELGVTVAYGEILSPEVLAIPGHGFLNVHPSLLPKYRGAAPIQWPVLLGDRRSGVTIIRMDPGVDTGPMLAQVGVKIEPDENAGQLHDRLAALGADVLVETIMRPGGIDAVRTDQDETGACRAPKLTKQDGWIDWRAPAEEIRNFIRAMTPWPSAFSELNPANRRRKLRLVVLAAHVLPIPDTKRHDPGTIYCCTSGSLLVATGDGALEIKSLQPAGKRVMTAAEFLRGYQVVEGDKLESPPGTSLNRLMRRARPRRRHG